MAMGEISHRTPSKHPNPTTFGSKMGGAPISQNGIFKRFRPTAHVPRAQIPGAPGIAHVHLHGLALSVGLEYGCVGSLRVPILG